MSPRPIKPIAGFKRSLLNRGRHETGICSAQNEETIVAEFGLDTDGSKSEKRSGSLGAVGERQDAGSAAGRSGGSAERLVVRLRCNRSFGRGLGTGLDGDTAGGNSGVRFFFDAHQILIRNFPPEVLVLPALLEILLQKDRPPGIRHKNPRGGQKDLAGAILHLYVTPEKRRVASHPVPSVRGDW
jgi:hypothetical protein